jgi:hypothetical protein
LDHIIACLKVKSKISSDSSFFCIVTVRGQRFFCAFFHISYNRQMNHVDITLSLNAQAPSWHPTMTSSQQVSVSSTAATEGTTGAVPSHSGQTRQVPEQSNSKPQTPNQAVNRVDYSRGNRPVSAAKKRVDNEEKTLPGSQPLPADSSDSTRPPRKAPGKRTSNSVPSEQLDGAAMQAGLLAQPVARCKAGKKSAPPSIPAHADAGSAGPDAQKAPRPASNRPKKMAPGSNPAAASSVGAMSAAAGLPSPHPGNQTPPADGASRQGRPDSGKGNLHRGFRHMLERYPQAAEEAVAEPHHPQPHVDHAPPPRPAPASAPGAPDVGPAGAPPAARPDRNPRQRRKKNPAAGSPAAAAAAVAADAPADGIPGVLGVCAPAPAGGRAAGPGGARDGARGRGGAKARPWWWGLREDDPISLEPLRKLRFAARRGGWRKGKGRGARKWV